ncbi:uncharacterized protein H6S33_010996 [Morchella sextelata]|uniref:uncharacterized protein n=1 Tax=Morchella sextelata TaxID=1174677 RepID=UPI001D0420F4|nr:uncharacterized protein H6S33_010996 [Morchella sextelata]KAH0611731.1 hypothetical protein H6S33_010996 [Morchella sextelata]
MLGIHRTLLILATEKRGLARDITIVICRSTHMPLLTLAAPEAGTDIYVELTPGMWVKLFLKAGLETGDQNLKGICDLKEGGN